MEAKRMKQPSIDVDQRVVKIHKGCLFVLRASVYCGEKPKPQCWQSSDIIDFSWGTLRYVTQGEILIEKQKERFRLNLERRVRK